MINQNLAISVDGLQMPAYLARPEEGSGPHPAVIVLQEIFGFNNEVKRITDLVASAGYVGLAINYCHRTHPSLNEPYNDDGLKRGFEAAGNVSKDSLRADVGAAIDWLAQQNFVKRDKVATWGFGFGATAAWFAASLPQVSGAVCFYGPYISKPMPNGENAPIDDAGQIGCPVLFCFGGLDSQIPAEDIALIDRAHRAAGKPSQIQIYPDVGHAFFRHGSVAGVADSKRFSDEAVGEAVADSWNVVQSFFKKTLH
ncbi:MAG: dienelactone hydrolase family protein [Vulcanimicrobiaceae bacterium]